MEKLTPEQIQRVKGLGCLRDKRTAMGRPLSRVFTDPQEILAVIERAINLFREEGIAGERFADTVTRLGFDYVEEKLLG